MNKKICVILFIISIFTNLILVNQSIATTTSLELQPVYQIADLDPGSYEPYGVGVADDGVGVADYDFIQTYTSRFTNALLIIAIIIAIIVIIIIGIKYMVGSAQERAEYKKNLIPVLSGILFISFLTPILVGIAGLSDSIQRLEESSPLYGTEDPELTEPPRAGFTIIYDIIHHNIVNEDDVFEIKKSDGRVLTRVEIDKPDEYETGPDTYIPYYSIAEAKMFIHNVSYAGILCVYDDYTVIEYISQTLPIEEYLAQIDNDEELFIKDSNGDVVSEDSLFTLSDNSTSASSEEVNVSIEITLNNGAYLNTKSVDQAKVFLHWMGPRQTATVRVKNKENVNTYTVRNYNLAEYK